MSQSVSRRAMLRQSALFGGGMVLGGASLARAGDPVFPGIRQDIDLAFQDLDVLPLELPGRFDVGGELLADGVQYAGNPAVLDQKVIQSFASTQVPGCETAVVQTLDAGRHACAAALRSGRFDSARIAVAEMQQDSQGRNVLVFPKGSDGLVTPAASYTSPMQIGMTDADRHADKHWVEMLAGIKGHDGVSLTGAFDDFDRQLWLPGDHHDPFMYAGQGLFGGNGLFGGRRQQQQQYGNNCQVQCQPCVQNQCGYAYGQNCKSGNCNLRPLGTVGGLLRGEFLRPVSSAGGLRHLKFGQRIVARLFPRVAYNKGWINCEMAHLLLVKRLFWAIVIGVAAGTAGGGGGAALIFLG